MKLSLKFGLVICLLLGLALGVNSYLFLRNQAESMCFQLEKLMKEHADKLKDSDKQPLEAAIAKTREVAKTYDTSAIKAALWALPDAQRIAITLMDLCGFTAAQVAAITGAPRGTVLARVHRGRKTLALSLAGEPEPARPPGAAR